MNADVKRYRKKPVVIEAMHYPVNPTAAHNAAMHRWVNDNGGRTDVVSTQPDPGDTVHITIVTLEGDLTLTPGDYVIRGVAGEFYPCKPDIFEATYDGPITDAE